MNCGCAPISSIHFFRKRSEEASIVTPSPSTAPMEAADSSLTRASFAMSPLRSDQMPLSRRISLPVERAISLRRAL